MNSENKSGIQSKSEKIALLWSNPYAYEIATQLIKLHRLHCRCQLVPLHSIGQAAKTQVANGAKVIVCRGDGARRKIQEQVSVPVVSVKYSFSDFVSTIDLALQYGNRIAMVVYTQDLFETVKRENYFWHMQTTLIHVHDDQEAREEIAKLVAEGIDVIIGGTSTQRTIHEFNVPFVLLQANEYAIFEAIEDAAHSLRVIEEQELRYETISVVVESSAHGIMTVSKSGVIMNINHAARRLLGISKQVVGLHYEGNVPFPDLIHQTLSGKHFNNYLFEYNGSYLVLNSLPIMLEDMAHGMVINIQGAEDVQTLENKLRKRTSGRGQIAKYHFRDIIGTSPEITQAKHKAMLYAGVDSTVMISGQSGTGKELFAQSIHNASQRRNAPFVAVNCAAFPESLLESELFGYEKGAFTGANSEGKAGIFEQAHKGTIFLDEIGEMPLSLQSRLLRVLQEREVVRLGGKTVIPVDIRVITATNRDLFSEMLQGKFRRDLYYRLNVLPLHLPSLQQRQCDIPMLADVFLKSFCEKYGRNISGFSTQAVELLKSHNYYGNIRELSNVVERAVILSQNSRLSEQDIQSIWSDPFSMEPYPSPENDPLQVQYRREADQLERTQITQALEHSSGNLQRAAQLLGISRTTLWRRMKKYGLTHTKH